MEVKQAALTMLNVAARLEIAARTVASLEPGWWTGGIVYILKTLEDTAPDDSHLRGIRDAIDERLEKGAW